MKSSKRPYIEMNTSYYLDPRILKVGVEASGLFMFSIFEAKRQSTLRYVFTDEAVKALVKDSTNPIKLADDLVSVGLFIRDTDGYRLATDTKLFRLHTGE